MSCMSCCRADEGDIKVVPVAQQSALGSDEVVLKASDTPKVAEGAQGDEIFGSSKRSKPVEEEAPKSAPAPAPSWPKASAVVSKGAAGVAKPRFTAKIRTAPGKQPGIGVDLSEGSYLRVNRLDGEGSVPSYNAGAPESDRVCVGDFILQVNSVRSDAMKMMKALHSDSDVTLLVSRPSGFSIEGLAKAGLQLGLDVSYYPRSTSLVVKQVREGGAIHAWNEGASEDEQVRKNDHIWSVNGKTGNSRDLHSTLGSAEMVDLCISRPFPE